MVHRFRFPVVLSHRGRLTHTYASVTGSVIKRIKEGKHGEYDGIPVCPPDDQFEIILHPGRGHGLPPQHMYGDVHLRFSYPNLYLEAFRSQGIWRRFSDKPADVVPGVASEPLPFESGYHNRGMGTNFRTLRFGKNTVVEIYKVLGTYPNNPGGVEELKEALSKVCVLIAEALRFPQLRRLLVYLMKWEDTKAILEEHTDRFHDWGTYCRTVREGREAFQPIHRTGVYTFDQLLSLVGMLLHVKA
jgi:hypothetical protein